MPNPEPVACHEVAHALHVELRVFGSCPGPPGTVTSQAQDPTAVRPKVVESLGLANLANNFPKSCRKGREIRWPMVAVSDDLGHPPANLNRLVSNGFASGFTWFLSESRSV